MVLPETHSRPTKRHMQLVLGRLHDQTTGGTRRAISFHVLCTAVEYNIPVVWVIWNNFGWVSIRDIQLGMFGGREHGTMFHQGANKKPYNPDFAAWAKASGVDALTVSKSEDFAGALEHAIRANKPFVLDVHVDAEVRPPSTGAWQLPPTPHKEPVFGSRFIPDAAPVK